MTFLGLRFLQTLSPNLAPTQFSSFQLVALDAASDGTGLGTFSFPSCKREPVARNVETAGEQRS